MNMGPLLENVKRGIRDRIIEEGHEPANTWASASIELGSDSTTSEYDALVLSGLQVKRAEALP